jgi:hypothetical protein
MSLEPPNSPPRSIAEMIGDWLREASVLVAVFGWLDKSVRDEAISGAWAFEVLALALLLFALGAAVERSRRPK